jgi:hypothetical protein
VHLKRTRYFALYRINVCNKVLPVQHNYMPNPGKTKQIPQYDLARTKLCIYQSESFKSDARSILRKFVQSHEFLHIYKIKPVPVPEYREYPPPHTLRSGTSQGQHRLLRGYYMHKVETVWSRNTPQPSERKKTLVIDRLDQVLHPATQDGFIHQYIHSTTEVSCMII